MRPRSLVTRPLFVAVRRSRPDSESIIARFNSQLRQLIADRTYHRLLHVDWIRADVDGDGVPEDVPHSDKAGTAAPEQVYTLSTTTTAFQSSKTVPLSPRFYLGGSIYEDWSAVPNKYKVADPDRPEASRSTASVFKFVW